MGWQLGTPLPLNVTGLPRVSMRFGTSMQGLPVSEQIVRNCLVEPTIVHVAPFVEALTPTRGHPSL